MKSRINKELVSYTKHGHQDGDIQKLFKLVSRKSKLCLKITSITPDKLEDVSASPRVYHLALVLQHLLLGTDVTFLQNQKGKF